MVASRDPEIDEPGPDDLYDVGVAGVVARMIKVPDGTLRILVQGAQRVRHRRVRRRPSPTSWRAIEELPDELEPSPELEALFRNVQTTFSADHRAGSRTCPRSCRSRWPTSRTRPSSRT